MTVQTTRSQPWYRKMFSAMAVFTQWLTEPAKTVAENQHARARLLSGLSILLSLSVVLVSLFSQHMNGTLWITLLVTWGVFMAGYLVSRTRYFRAAIPLLIIGPAVPAVIVAVMQIPGVDILATLMWLAVPLLISSLILTSWYSHLITLVYSILAVLLSVFGILDYESLALLICFFLMITFFSVTYSITRGKSLKVIEKQLAEQRSFQKTITESEAKYRTLFEVANDAIILTDFKTGLIIDANQTAATLLGIPKEKLRGMPHRSFFPPGMVTDIEHRFMSHAVQFKNQAFYDDLVLQRPDGSQIQVNTANTFFELNGKQITQSVYRDITARHILEKRLKESEEKFSKAFMASPASITITNLNDKTFLEVNDSFTRTTGYTLEDLNDKTADDFNMWVSSEHRARMVQAAAKREKIINEEMEFRYKSGKIGTSLVSTEFLDIAGDECLMVVSSDITDSRRARQALSQSEEQLEKVLSLIPQQVFITRLSDGKVIDINEGVTRATGFTRKEVIGRTAKELDFWADYEDRNQMIRILEREGRVYNQECDFRMKSGEIRTALYCAEVITLNDERCLISIITDIAERKKIERSLKTSEEKFSRAFRYIPESIAITRISDQKFIDVNEVFCQAVNKSREEIIGHNAKELGFPEPEGNYQRLVNKVREHGAISNEEQMVLSPEKTGTLLYSADIVEIGGEECLIGVYHDITNIKATEKALRISEEKFSRAFHAIPESIAITRLKDRQFVDVNDVFCRAINKSHDEVIGHTDLELGLPDPEGTYERIVNNILNRGPISNEEQQIKEPGQSGTLLFSADIVEIDGEPCMISIINDISKVKAMENDLRDSEEKFSKTFHAIPERLCIAGINNGLILDVNEAFITGTGRTREETIGHNVYELGFWRETGEREKIIADIEKDGPIFNREISHTTPSGDLEITLLSADIINIKNEPYLITISHDISERKKMEQAVRDSEEKFYTVFQSMPESVSISTVKDGFFVEVNDGFCRSGGHTREEIIGHTIQEFSIWEDPKRRENIIQEIREHGKITNREHSFQTHTGEIQTALISFDIVNIKEQPCLVSISNDISERKKMEQAVRESEIKFRKVFESIPESVSILRTNDGRFVDANDTFCASIERSRQEVIGHNAEELGLWQSSESREELIKEINNNGKVINREYSFTRPLGNIKTALLSADIMEINGERCMIVISNDISERKKMEQAVKDSEKRFSKAFNDNPDGITISSLNKRKFIEVNDSFLRMTGYAREEVIGHTALELGIWANPAQRDKMEHRLNKRLPNQSEEMALRTKSGRVLETLFSSEFTEINGEPCVVAVNKDITERKKIEQSLKESEQKFNIAFHKTPEAIVINRIRDGIFLDVNEAFCRQINMSHDQIVGHTGTELGLQDPLGTFEQRMQIVLNGGRISNQEINISARGDTPAVHALISADYVEIGGEPCMLSVVYDITERKKMEKALKESENKFHRAFQTIPESIAISRVEDGMFIEVNQNFCRVTGRTHDEIVGHTGDELGLKNRPGQRGPIIKEIKEKGPILNREVVIKDPLTGEMTATLFSSDIIEINGEPCMISVSTDITERKRMEQVVKLSEEKFHKVFQSIPEHIIITRIKDSVFIDANENFCKASGHTREELIGHTATEVGLGNKPNHPEDLIKTIQEQGGIFNREIITDSPEGMKATLFSARLVDIAGDPCMLSVSTDITDRKKMEQAVKTSEELFSKAFQSIPESITVSRAKDGTFIAVNDNFLHSFNLTLKEVLGNSAEKLKLWGSGSHHELTKTIQQQGSIRNQERQFVLPSGVNQTILFSADNIEIGGELCTLTISNDITERKRMEQSLRESEEKLSKVFQSIPESVTVSRLKDHVFIDVNDNFCRIVGLPREEIIGHTGQEVGLIGRPDQPDLVGQALKNEGQIHNREVIIGEGTDKMKATLFSASIINIAGESCMISISTDITERKRMEQALKESEAKFFTAFHKIPESLAITRINDSVFIDVNESFCVATGLSHDQIIGHSGKELGLVDPDAVFEQMMQNILNQGRITNKEVPIGPGRGGTALVSADVIEVNGEPCMLTLMSNITEMKRMEKAIRESEEKFSKAFHAIPEAISISKAEDGVFVEVNESFARSVNHTRESIIGRRGLELGLPDPVGDFFKLVKRIRQHGGITNEETRVTLNNGDIRTMLLSAELLEINGEDCVICITNDITERKRMEQSLQESEEKFSKIFRLTPLQVIISRLRGNELPITIDVNDSFMERSGFTREEVIGKTMADLKMWKNASDSMRLQRLIQKDGRYSNVEADIITKTGEVRSGLLSSESLEINGEPCLISIFTDITDRKQAEADLKQAMLELKLSSAQLKATNKELESFSYSVSHDLRSPLRTIDGFSQALLEDYGPKLDETAQDYLNRMRNASQKMGELIDGLLKLSRLTRTELRRESVDLSALAQDIATRLQETDPERQAEFIIQPGLKATGDSQMLRVMMENLLNNAWKFTRKTPMARIEFGIAPSNGKQTFFIKDNGAGFDMAYVDKLFGAFQRLHNVSEFPGTGIGLATVQRIINRHGGNIRAEGAVDKGATFYFSL